MGTKGYSALARLDKYKAEFICKVIMQGLKGRSSFVVSSGFVSGLDFSRAVENGKRIGLQPLLWRILQKMHVQRKF
jgi:hypothetical protein